MGLWCGPLEGLVISPLFWKNRRVFITGHTGFKGSWLSLWLHALGADVHGYALAPPTSPSLFELADVAGLMNSVIGDIRDLHSLKDAISNAKPEIVIHMAAQPLVRESYVNPVETFEINVMGTVNILEAVRSIECVSALINVTTDKCYENKEWVWGYRENEPLGGHDPYSSSKACSELVSSAYRNSFFDICGGRVGHATARAGNVIGGGDWGKDRLMTDIFSAVQADVPITIRSPNSIRPWQHVLEPLRGYLLLSEKIYQDQEKYLGAWTFGPNDSDSKSVGWMVKNISRKLNGSLRWEIESGEHPHEAAHLKLNISKANEKLNWHPLISIDEALTLTVDWFNAYQKGVNLRDFTLSQIKNYQHVMSLSHED